LRRGTPRCRFFSLPFLTWIMSLALLLCYVFWLIMLNIYYLVF
jgi:hypothetical protein